MSGERGELEDGADPRHQGLLDHLDKAVAHLKVLGKILDDRELLLGTTAERAENRAMQRLLIAALSKAEAARFVVERERQVTAT